MKTQSPTRSGCVTASMMPATKFASVWRAAKPRIAAAIAPEASSEAAIRLTPSNCESAIATPIRTITTDSRRRMKRRRVSVSGEISPRATACASRSPRLEDPAPRLRAALLARLGIDVGEERALAAIRAEIAYYRAHLHLGRDARSLAQ